MAYRLNLIAAIAASVCDLGGSVAGCGDDLNVVDAVHRAGHARELVGLTFGERSGWRGVGESESHLGADGADGRVDLDAGVCAGDVEAVRLV